MMAAVLFDAFSCSSGAAKHLGTDAAGEVQPDSGTSAEVAVADLDTGSGPVDASIDPDSAAGPEARGDTENVDECDNEDRVPDSGSMLDAGL